MRYVKKLSAIVICIVSMSFILSCGKNAPRSMAENLVGTYNGSWIHTGWSMSTGNFSTTYAGDLTITQGSDKSSVIVEGIEFKLERNKRSYTVGQHSFTFSEGAVPSVKFITNQSSPGGNSHKEFYGSKTQ